MKVKSRILSIAISVLMILSMFVCGIDQTAFALENEGNAIADESGDTNDTIDEEYVFLARKIFVESFEKEIIEDVNSDEWLERCSFPIGMDNEGNLFDLDE